MTVSPVNPPARARCAQMRLECQVINLDDRAGRLAQISSALGRAEIRFRRFPAVDGRGRRRQDFAQFSPALARARYGRALSPGEMGCFLSHVGVVEAFLAGDATHALVLEDDAAPGPQLANLIGDLVDWLDTHRPEQWDLVNLGRAADGPASPVATLSGGQGLLVAHAFPLTTSALLWSRAGAARFLAAAQQPYAPIDQFLCDLLVATGRGFAFTVAPVGVSGAASDIGDRFWQRLGNAFRPWGFIAKSRRLRRNARKAKAAMRACHIPAEATPRHVD